MKLRTLTLGCKVNQYETEYVREGLLGIGYEDAIEEEHAELCIVNTCTVTAEGDSKSRQAIRRMARRNPGAKIVVMGCYATRAPEEVAELPGVSQVVTDSASCPTCWAVLASPTFPRASAVSVGGIALTSKFKTGACYDAASASSPTCGQT